MTEDPAAPANDADDADDIRAGLEAERDALLGAALPHIPFDGWSNAALEAGARDAGLEQGDVRRLFPAGPVDAVLRHSTRADGLMRAAFAALDPPPERTRDKIAALIRLRLEGAARDREAVRLGLALLAKPQHLAVGVKALARTADAIWRAAGDRSADFNWYTKRALVSAVYMATVAYWLNDRSPGFADSWNFLDRRIDTVLKLPMKAKALRGRIGLAWPRPERIAAELRRRRSAGGW